MLSRYFVSFNIAAVITFGLFFAMQMLISNGEVALTDKNKRIKVILPEVRTPEDVNDRIKPPDELVIVPEPEIRDIPLTSDPRVVGPNIYDDPRINADPDPKLEIVGTGPIDGIEVPIIKPAPQYPIRMLEKGIEGFVRVQFDVTVNGNTENVIAVASSHQGFERNAIKAAQKFKFKPKVVDGEPMRVTGVFNRIEFKLQK